jgi:hypothetical protein
VQQRREIGLAHHPPHRLHSTGSLGLNSQREKSQSDRAASPDLGQKGCPISG